MAETIEFVSPLRYMSTVAYLGYAPRLREALSLLQRGLKKRTFLYAHWLLKLVCRYHHCSHIIGQNK